MANPQMPQVIAVGMSQVGYREGYVEGGWNNNVRYADEVPGLSVYQGQSWCMTFTSWIAMRAGVPTLFPRGVDCSAGVAWFQAASRWSWYPAVGAQVFYGDSGSEHTGIVYAYDATYIWTIEGNTSDNGSTEGDGVYLRKRRRADAIVYGYGLPAYAEGITTADTALKGVSGYTYAASNLGPSRAVLAKAGMLVGNLVAENLSVNGTANADRLHLAGGVVAMDNVTAAPTSSPMGGAVWYSQGGIPKVRTGSGTVIDLSSTGGGTSTATNEFGPADHGLVAWTMNPASCTPSGTTLSAGVIYFLEVILRSSATISSLCAVIGTAGSGLTSGQCLAGLYTASGTRVGVTADMSTTWNSAGDKTMALTSSYSAAAGKYYVALLFAGTTSPTFACGSTLGNAFTPGNAHLTSGSYRFCRSASGQTSLPASYTMTSATPDANNVWAAVA
ncbi:CHAP domain-containing protein [Streptomyces sp. PD-S100-1]|uniref:CHAP domain-containing protein n=1 Tax=Streptomyces sp. PD-S100-1 TaxID=3394351 RepID=UPI0039BD1984